MTNRLLTIVLLLVVLRRVDRALTMLADALAMLADVLTMIHLLDSRFVPTPEQAEVIAEMTAKIEELTAWQK